RLSKSFERASKSFKRTFCTHWNFGPVVNLVRTSLDVVRTRCKVFRAGDQLSQSRSNDRSNELFCAH
ncbi:hypothetical protein GIB67_010214, partial [Kingdonia uniflora]